MHFNFLQPTILEPTRITANSRTNLIDIFTNFYDKNINSGNLLDKISNHMPNFVIIKDDFNKKKIQNIKIRDMMKISDENLYKIDLKEIQNIDITNCQNVNEMHSLFQTWILNFINRDAPYRKHSKRKPS